MRKAKSAADLPYFFYGTLIDLELLAIVTGQPIDARAVKPATLAGYWRTGLTGKSYPMLMRRPGGSVDGILVIGLTRRARMRLATYEGVNYRLMPIPVESNGRAMAGVVFMFVGFGPGLRSDLRAWRLQHWRRKWKRRALRRAGRLRTLPGEA